jgi:putative CocE/NonD family hydrolase
MKASHILYPTEGVKLVKNVMIPMRDGVRLAADLYMPHGEAATRGRDRFPVVMDYIPYRKDEVNPSYDYYSYLPKHGYIVARVDIRGTGGSEGVNVDEYTLQEQLDGYDAIEWLAAQPWCDGHVNMMGISYGGFTCLQVASHAPPHLTSIIPVDFTDDRYTDDCHYRGGLMRKYYDIGHYGNMMIVYNAMPPHMEWSGERWAALWEEHLACNEPYLLKWFKHQTNGDYWRPGSVRDFPERIKCPVFMIGGWKDGYTNPPFRLMQALRVPRKVLIGPWNHAMPDVGVPGPRIDYLHEVVRWLDYWCKGEQNGVMDEPPVVIFMQHYQDPIVDRLETEGEWRAEVSWPPPGFAHKTLFTSASGRLLDSPADEPGYHAFEYNPAVGIMGGLWSGGLPFGLPGDQRLDEAYSLVYTTEPLEEDIYIIGNPRALLFVSSTASVIGFAASLCDVAPDGTSHLVAKGMLNATRRKSLREPEPLVPGEIYELDVEIDCTAWKFARGHRIRLSVASADWPNVWPTPEPATNQVYFGGMTPSRLILPIVPARGSAEPPRFLPSRQTRARHADAVRPPTWQTTIDMLSGRVAVTIGSEGESRLNEHTVMQRRSSVRCEVDPRKPADASAYGQTMLAIVRSNQTIRGTSDVVVQASRTHFHVTINLEIRVNDAPHFSRRWVETIRRELL